MIDLIRRQAAINSHIKMIAQGLDWIPAYHIEQLPSAERHGRWETFSPLSRPRCSVCGELCIGTHAFDYTLTDYCPNCGAKMNEVEDNG